MSDKIFLTGGNGFIGSHVVDLLVKSNRDIVCLVQKGSNVDYIKDHIKNGKVKVAWGDIRNKDDIDKGIKGCDVVYHFVAIAGKQNVPEKDYWDVNFEGTKKLLDSCIENEIKKFIYCSSVGVMGNIKKIPAAENTPYNPTNTYEKTKMEAEKETLRYVKEFGLNAIIIRPAVVYGPRNISNMSRMFGSIQNGKFFVIGSGNNLWHMTYVEDLAKGFLQAEKAKLNSGEIIILGGENPVTMNEMTRTASDLLGVKKPKQMPLLLASVAGWCFWVIKKIFKMKVPIEPSGVKFLTNHRAYSIKKAKKLIGYKPEFPIRKGLEKTFSWYKENGILK